MPTNLCVLKVLNWILPGSFETDLLSGTSFIFIFFLKISVAKDSNKDRFENLRVVQLEADPNNRRMA